MVFLSLKELSSFASISNFLSADLLNLEDTLPFTTQFRLLTTLKMNALENTVGKGENVGNQHFLLYTLCFLLYQRGKSSL